MDEIAREALAVFEGGFNCSQAVVAAFSGKSGLDRETALKIACPFGGGMGGMQQTCGAVTGAFMVLGLKYGKCRPEDTEQKQRTYAAVKEFSAEFTRRHESTNCRQLIDCDLSTPSGMEYAKKYKVFDRRCTQFIKTAVELLMKEWDAE